MTIDLIAELAGKHGFNYYGGWGNSWQSALWSENIAFASYYLTDTWRSCSIQIQNVQKG